jgi:undecaprenyl diphosphate synthase
MIPKHTAIIMDGNGRWAEQKGMPRVFGHQNGVTAVKKIVEEANKHKIEYLTLFTFSVKFTFFIFLVLIIFSFNNF